MTLSSSLTLPSTTEALSVILKLPGDTCNINCYYCFEKRKPYDGHQRIQAEALRRFLDACEGRQLRIELHGGEPLLLPQEHMVELLSTLRSYEGKIGLSIQTNGLLLTDSWIELFATEWPDIEIGVSHDGPPDIHNRFRVDYRDDGTAEQVDACLHRLARHDVNVGISTVITQAALGNATRIVDYFCQFESVRFLKLSPCFDYDVTTTALAKGNRRSILRLNPEGREIPGWATSPLDYADFVIEAFEAWKAGAYRHFVIEPLMSIIRILAGGQPAFCHFSEKKCSHVLTLYPDGRIGSCDELRMPDAELAHLDELTSVADIVRLQTNPDLHRRLDGLYQKCETCSYRSTCSGGCLATRLAYEGTPLDDEYCAYRAKLIDFVSSQLEPSERPSQAAPEQGRRRSGG